MGGLRLLYLQPHVCDLESQGSLTRCQGLAKCGPELRRCVDKPTYTYAALEALIRLRQNGVLTKMIKCRGDKSLKNPATCLDNRCIDDQHEWLLAGEIACEVLDLDNNLYTAQSYNLTRPPIIYLYKS